MATRSLNKVMLIGNLTRDPELKYTPQGTAVCTFGLATNRSWTTESGEKKEDAEFHRIVVWNKLAELCAQLIFKGRKVYVEGRLQTRTWTGQDGVQRQSTEVVVQDMMILDNKRAVEGGDDQSVEGLMPPDDVVSQATETQPVAEEKTSKKKPKKDSQESGDPVTNSSGEMPSEDEIPF